MPRLEDISWEDRAKAAERTVEVLKSKVFGLYNGDSNAIQKRLERAREREENNRRRREVMEARAAEMKKYTEGLEAEVAERTRDLKVILDNVTFGFLVVNRDLQVQDGYTQSCCSLLGADSLSSAHLLDALGVDNERERDMQLMCFDQVFEDMLPEELLLDQLPQRYEIGERALSVEGRTIRDDDNNVTGLLMTIADRSALEAAERENVTNRVLLRILKEKEPFKHFIADAKAQLALARESIDDVAYVRRVAHTIKGNAASYGLDDIAEHIHRIEDQETIDLDDLNAIASDFRSFLQEHKAVLEIDYDDSEDDIFAVSSRRLEELKAMIEAGTNDVELRRWTAEVYLKPASLLMGPFQKFVEKLAERLEKDVTFNAVGESTLVDTGTMQPVFSNLTHLVRNAVDHGIEPPHERGDKPERGRITLEVRDQGGAWILDMHDDGRGIDVTTLVERSIEKGLVSKEDADGMSDDDKLRLVFLDGLSSAKETTDISGRGVGMSAVLGEVQRLNGSIDIHSEVGKGTRFVVRVPKPEVLSLAIGQNDDVDRAASQVANG